MKELHGTVDAPIDTVASGTLTREQQADRERQVAEQMQISLKLAEAEAVSRSSWGRLFKK